ncbi:MAG: hypothetical protein NZ765_07245 [Anaerolineae bacterium]|nr:hypothetical protein [Anaerolineae bacterium]MDW8071340.1 hypothetical protein [Anaerolineae bacterium]
MSETRGAPAFPGIARVTFIIHFIVALVIGVLLLFIPATFGGWFGYPEIPDLIPVIRALGAILLGLGAGTSLCGIFASRWESVEYVVRGEIAYLALQTIVFVVSAIIGSGPLIGNIVFAVISVILLVLFIISWVSRPR